jgi:hypothetical protein
MVYMSHPCVQCYYSLSSRALGHTALRARRQRAVLARLAVAAAVVQDALLAAPERVVAAHEAGLEAAAVTGARGALGLSSVGRRLRGRQGRLTAARAPKPLLAVWRLLRGLSSSSILGAAAVPVARRRMMVMSWVSWNGGGSPSS